MHSIKSLASLAMLTAASSSSRAAAAAVPIEFEYYPSGDLACSSGSLSALFITAEDHCYDLGNAAESFHIGGPSTQDQVPEGCVITGYAGPGCGGSVGLEVRGPSDAGSCYITGVFMGDRAAVGSVRYTCS
ncbi:hypothetical protein F4778DRAFT_711643 [Xylariomycetidae sp. FL2044]|nr:hypothetical protein F4778DRAFT_711643 [Xylariomycetidae sp. FL2044]